MKQYTIKYTEDGKYGNQYDSVFGNNSAEARNEFYRGLDITGRLQAVHNIVITETTEAEAFFFGQLLDLQLAI